MFRGIYTAANAMTTKQNQIEMISNNIANVDTTGFKKDVGVIEAFSEKLLYKRQDVEGYMRTTKNNAKVNNKKLPDGSTKTDIEITRGYLTLEDRNGKGYYKSASVTMDNDGYLRTVYRDYNSKTITKFGAYLLDANGNKIKVNTNNQNNRGGKSELNIDTAGNLRYGNNVLAKLIAPEARKSIGTINSGSLTERVMINYNQGALERTENDTHIALDGEGFLKVRVGGTNSVKYTRGGAITMDKNRILQDYLGSVLLTENGKEITVPENSAKLDIKRDGTVYSISTDGQRENIGKLAIVNVTNKEDMQKYGHSYMQMIGNAQPNEEAFSGRLVQGYLEHSNVNSIDEMVDMIAMYRGFESDQKVINAYDQIMQKAANDIGKV